ncbi:(2Fe-2S) ferredoxin domain-containing protein [Methylobacterium marchantiae]|uniref:(2Fe-2S) ferredoxin domain-containing protein n=1 Tax=Methylobacterium marchantiae TaxID=600331 RepID=A0ABW3X2N0_9HYPH
MAKHDKDTTVRTAKSGYSDIVMVCSKCTKRVGLKKDEIRGRLKREVKRRGLGRVTRVVSTGCLGPCPKRFVAVATSFSLSRNRIVLIDPDGDAAQTLDTVYPAARRFE